MNRKKLMEFGLSALREQVPPIPKTRPSAPPTTTKPDYTSMSNLKGFMARRQMHGKPYIK